MLSSECFNTFSSSLTKMLLGGFSGFQRCEKTVEVRVGDIKIGGGNPVVIQSMALGGGSLSENCDEVVTLAKAGSELIRVALNSDDSAKSMPYIRDALVKNGFSDKILIGCGQYEVERLLRQYPECILAMGKIRINPGNIGFGNKRDTKFESVIETAIINNLPVRIGVNGGSIDESLFKVVSEQNEKEEWKLDEKNLFKKAIVLSALLSAHKAMQIGLPKNKIILSCKVSRVRDLISIYQMLACLSDFALHLGLTEAGSGIAGIVHTTSALSSLLLDGIGDTIRASLSTGLVGNRTDEVFLCKEILQSIDLRYFSPRVISCPGCNRTNKYAFGYLVDYVNDYIKKNFCIWRKNGINADKMVVAVMGCVVNGPGESKKSDIAISMPGNNEGSSAVVYIDGKMLMSLHGDNLAIQFCKILEDYVSKKYSITSS